MRLRPEWPVGVLCALTFSATVADPDPALLTPGSLAGYAFLPAPLDQDAVGAPSVPNCNRASEVAALAVGSPCELPEGGSALWVGVVNGDAALVAASSSEPSSLAWGAGSTATTDLLCMGNATPDTVDADFDGAAHAACLDTQNSNAPAHAACSALSQRVQNVGSDWRLPSSGEAVLLAQQDTALGIGSGTLWSGSERDGTTAWTVSVGGAVSITSSTKSVTHAVRCVRTLKLD